MDVREYSAKDSISPREMLLRNMLSKARMEEKKKGWKNFFTVWETHSEHIPISDNDKTIDDCVSGMENEISQLLKEIRRILFKRNESNILRDGKFEEWSKRLFNTCLDIRDHVPLDALKKHNRKIFKRNLTQIKKNIQKYGSDLGEKLILRQEMGKRCDKTLTLDIRKEWERLLKVMPLEDLVVYSLDIFKTSKLKEIQKRQTEPVVTKELFNKSVKGRATFRCSSQKLGN